MQQPVAQIVLSKTKSGKWKIAGMSLKQVEAVQYADDPDSALQIMYTAMRINKWEQLGDD